MTGLSAADNRLPRLCRILSRISWRTYGADQEDWSGCGEALHELGSVALGAGDYRRRCAIAERSIADTDRNAADCLGRPVQRA